MIVIVDWMQQQQGTAKDRQVLTDRDRVRDRDGDRDRDRNID